MLSLLSDAAVAANHHQTFCEFSHGVNDVGWFEIAWLAAVDVENLDCVLDDTLKVDRKVVRDTGVLITEDELPKELTVLAELLVLFVELRL